MKTAKWVIIAIAFLLLALAVFIYVNRAPEENLSGTTHYYIDNKQTDEQSFMTLKNSLIITTVSYDTETKDKDFSSMQAKDPATNKNYIYSEGQENGVNTYRIRETSI